MQDKHVFSVVPQNSLMLRFSLVFVLTVLAAFTPQKLVKVKINEEITVMLPEDLKPMTEDDLVQRFPSVRAPLGAFTDQNRQADFTVNVSATQWPDGDLKVASQFFKSGITNLYDKVYFISEGTQEVHGKTYIFFEFESRVNGTKAKLGEQEPVVKYSFVQYLVEPKRTLVFSFSCVKPVMPQWQKQAHAVMKSLRVK
ncbi:MAG TPA: hypothetical protein DCE81_14430 [Cytophagales bacterium]|nr:hypothetical protein [Cytophagales bacterium]